jgi:hypothetical protein
MGGGSVGSAFNRALIEMQVHQEVAIDLRVAHLMWI